MTGENIREKRNRLKDENLVSQHQRMDNEESVSLNHTTYNREDDAVIVADLNRDGTLEEEEQTTSNEINLTRYVYSYTLLSATVY